MKKFSVEVSTGVQKDTQGLESLSVIKVVPWKEIKALLTFYISLNMLQRFLCGVVKWLR